MFDSTLFWQVVSPHVVTPPGTCQCQIGPFYKCLCATITGLPAIVFTNSTGSELVGSLSNMRLKSELLDTKRLTSPLKCVRPLCQRLKVESLSSIYCCVSVKQFKQLDQFLGMSSAIIGVNFSHLLFHSLFLCLFQGFFVAAEPINSSR